MRCKPPSRLIDLTGQTFNQLTVISRVPSISKSARWLCRCSCGNYKEVDSCHLRNGGVKSCGCLLKKQQTNKTHGLSKTRLYEIWHGMKGRCSNGNKNYGGRGIKICEKWEKSFIDFYNWAIENGYNESLTIDRVNVDGDYCPENCRWATAKEQANNKRVNVKIEFNGKSHTVSEWAKILDIKRSTLEKRLKTKSVEISFTKEVDKRKSHGKNPLSFEDWSK